MLKEVASKTNDQAGDGTTTATVLAQAIFTAGIKKMLQPEPTQWILSVVLIKLLMRLSNI